VVGGQLVVGFGRLDAEKIRDRLNEWAGSNSKIQVEPSLNLGSPPLAPSDKPSELAAFVRDGNATQTASVSTRNILAAETFCLRPECPECRMNMILTKDCDAPDRKMFECLRCGNVSEL
jgi:hypothetical protein